MSDIDQMLIGTVWTRSAGKHGPVTGIVDQTNNHGPRLKLDDGSHRRLGWAELDLGWSPVDSTSLKRFKLWKSAVHIEYLDRKDAELKSGLAALQTEIERETIVPVTEENGTAVEIEQTKECHGPWHKHKGQYQQVPLSQFSVIARGPNKGQFGALCDSCRVKQKESEARSRNRKIGAAAYLEERDKPFLAERKKPGPKPGTIHRQKPAIELVDQLIPGVETPEGITYRWKVSVTQVLEHIVQGKDFLDAAAQVSGLGEITKVEKL